MMRYGLPKSCLTAIVCAATFAASLSPLSVMAEAPIRIGASLSQTGSFAALGQNQLRGYQLCAKHANEKGGSVRMAIAMRDRVNELRTQWSKQGYDLDLGVGIAQGYATIGAVGFEGRWDYGAIGTVTNRAARLCGEAKGGQILVSSRVGNALEEIVQTEEVGALALKGLARPVPAFNVARLKTANP